MTVFYLFTVPLYLLAIASVSTLAGVYGYRFLKKIGVV